MGTKWENRLKMQMPPHRPNSIQISPRFTVVRRPSSVVTVVRRQRRFLALHLSNAAELMNRNGNADLYLMDTLQQKYLQEPVSTSNSYCGL